MVGVGKRGFTLVEALAALLIVTMAILVAGNALQVHADAAKRLEIRQQLLRDAESVLESLRCGALPAITGPVELGEPFSPSPEILSTTFVVATPQALPGLIHVTVRSRGYLRDKPVELQLETMMWRWPS
jgi:prepilin-type N-terminal cleavage/methylation domain-containing protein